MAKKKQRAATDTSAQDPVQQSLDVPDTAIATAHVVMCDALWSSDEDEVPPGEFRVFPSGEFTGVWDDGTEMTFVYDEESAAAVMARFQKVGNDIVIDYEHDTHREGVTGPRRAAGWTGLDARADGLFAQVKKWTSTAAQMLQDREYRYFSPVFDYDKKTMRVTAVKSIGLTNRPAMVGITPLAASAVSTTQDPPTDTPEGGEGSESMSTALLTALGADTEEAALEAIEAQATAIAERDEKIASLDTSVAEMTAARDEATAFIGSVMEAVGCEDRDKLVALCASHKDRAEKVEALTEQVAQMTAEREAAEKASLIEKAGVGHDRAAWLEKQPLETVRSYVEECCKTPEVPTAMQSAQASARQEDEPEEWFVEANAGKTPEQMTSAWAEYRKLQRDLRDKQGK